MTTLLPPPVHRSYSQITTYLDCGKKYELSRLIRVPETPAWYLIGGSAVHEVAEHLSLLIASGDPAKDTYLIDELWRLSWNKFEDAAAEGGVPQDKWRAAGRKTKDKPNGEDRDWWLTAGLDMCHKYWDWLAGLYEQGTQIYSDESGPWVERGATVRIGGVPVKMFLDLVLVLPGGELMVVDTKTGTKTPNDTQLRLYAMGMEKAKQPRPSLGAYFMARKGELSPPSVLPLTFDTVLDSMFEQADLGIRGGIFIPNPNAYCDSCSVNRFCAAYGGAEASEYDPILNP